MKGLWNSTYIHPYLAHLTWAVEYTNNISEEVWDALMSALIVDSKQSDCEVLIMLEIWGMQSSPSLPLRSQAHSGPDR